jgi:hypothetical protein
MSPRSRFLPLAVSFTIFATLAVAPVSAHPPEAPFDNTIFAPIDDESGFAFNLEITASGFVAPLKGSRAPGESGRIYVVDQPGKLWSVELSTGAKTVFLDVGPRLVTLGVQGPGTFDERGFLGAAFHPDYQNNGKLYTWTSEPTAGAPTFPTTLPPGSNPDHQNVLAEWVANDPGNPAAGVNVGSRRELMRIDWPQFNHDAGDIVFGPDGFLYVPMGDGGGADDEDGEVFAGAPIVGHGTGNAQNLTNPLGKIHRIDVNGNNSSNGQYGIPGDNPFVSTAGAVKEIWAYGLRNPFRLSFDTATGRLFAGDVGQNDIEEVSLIVKGGNHGWNRKEGTLCFDTRGTAAGVATTDCSTLPPLPPNLIDPVAQYDTHHEGHSVIGGFVYHGDAFPQLRGRYVFGEWSRLFGFPSGPDNYGRLLYLQQQNLRPGRLADVKEFRNFAEEAVELGLINPGQPPVSFDQTLSVLGFAQDDEGEIYALGNKTGRPFGDGGVMLKILSGND